MGFSWKAPRAHTKKKISHNSKIHEVMFDHLLEHSERPIFADVMSGRIYYKNGAPSTSGKLVEDWMEHAISRKSKMMLFDRDIHVVRANAVAVKSLNELGWGDEANSRQAIYPGESIPLIQDEILKFGADHTFITADPEAILDLPLINILQAFMLSGEVTFKFSFPLGCLARSDGKKGRSLILGFMPDILEFNPNDRYPLLIEWVKDYFRDACQNVLKRSLSTEHIGRYRSAGYELFDMFVVSTSSSLVDKIERAKNITGTKRILSNLARKHENAELLVRAKEIARERQAIEVVVSQ